MLPATTYIVFFRDVSAIGLSPFIMPSDMRFLRYTEHELVPSPALSDISESFVLPSAIAVMIAL